MTAALSLADQGFRVYLIEREGRLGGQMNLIHSTLEHENTSDFVQDLVRRVMANRKIKLYLNCEVEKVKGHIGNFTVTISEKEKGNGKGTELSCGAIVVATGAEPAMTREYLYGAIGQYPDAARAGRPAARGQVLAGREHYRHDPVRRVAEQGDALLQQGMLLDGD